MKAYIWGGPDTSSEAGRFRVVIVADGLQSSVAALKSHLRGCGRPELLSTTSLVEAVELDKVIYSDIEHEQS